MKTTSSHILDLHPRIGSFSQKSPKNFLGIFEKFKNVESFKNFPLPIFGYFAAVVALYHCAIIHSLSSSNKLSTGVGVFGLNRFLAHFFCF